MVNLAETSTADLQLWRDRLVQELAGSPEGFVQDNQLSVLHGPTPVMMDWVEKVNETI